MEPSPQTRELVCDPPKGRVMKTRVTKHGVMSKPGEARNYPLPSPLGVPVCG
jgi:hypothetical protein